MSLSDEERRLLEQMEQALAAEDPRLASTLRGGASNRRLRRRRAAVAGIGFLIGAAMLIGGMESHWVVSVLGFCAMVASAVVALNSFEKADKPAQPGKDPGVSARSGSSSAASNTAFMDKMEERWRRRQDEGL